MFKQYLSSPIGLILIEADEKNLLVIRFVEDKTERELKNPITIECVKQLKEYFAGKRISFKLPFNLDGTRFQNAVWYELLTLSYGETCSYSDVADAIGHPRAHRAVGTANRLNSFPIIIPCHRVIGKDNKLAGYACGVDKKAWLLKHEEDNQHKNAL